MDVGRKEHADELRKRQLLYGVVLYEAGSIGDGPVRSQGHVHKICPHNGWSGPELVEVWQGTAIVSLQQFVSDDPGHCIAVTAQVGDTVVIPPGWAHCIINADRSSRMMFGAFCDREYGFEYRAVRSRNGLAWVPSFNGDGSIRWTKNERYGESKFVERAARQYPELSLASGISIYKQFSESPDCVQWVSDPGLVADIWDRFIP
jgi:glucose-6-phosphate isomerase